MGAYVSTTADTYAKVVGGDKSAMPDLMAIILLIILAAGVLSWILPYFQKPNRRPTAQDKIYELSAQLTKEINGTDTFADPNKEGTGSFYTTLIRNLSADEQYLVNICPLTASLGGYLGRKEPGAFDSAIYIKHALAMGIRSFILPISVYTDDNKFPPNWPLSGKPAITCRDANGKIISLNGLTVKKFCEDLLLYGDTNNVQSSEPIILYLRKTAKYIPDSVKEEKDYVKLMSDIAKDLDIIPSQRRLTSLGGFGSGVGSQNESIILTQIPLTELTSKFIIFTDFETKIALKDAYKGVTPKLYDYTNFTVTLPESEKPGNARSIRISDISGSKINWADRARNIWHMTAEDDPLLLPETDLVDIAVSSGIQMIPVPFFMTPIKDTKPIFKLWDGFAWKLKPPAARFKKPQPVQPKPPNPAMNARVSPDLQPGQVSIQ